MMSSGFIEESNESPDPNLDDQRRRNYRLTGLGGGLGFILQKDSRLLVQVGINNKQDI